MGIGFVLRRETALIGLLCAGLAGCPTGDDGPEDGLDAGPDAGITADDIGLPCEYVSGSGNNPTNTCPQGLSCLITTSDGAYTTLANAFWEDQTTIYTDRQVGGGFVEEGYCTKVSTAGDASFSCPTGTVLKVHSPDVVACVKLCEQNADCGREGYVCENRYFDMPALAGGGFAPHCVRACQWDVPDCVRSAVGSTADGQVGLQAFLAREDLSGASQCQTNIGNCIDTPSNGASGPGGACAQTSDCQGGMTCYQGGRFFGPGLDGICALPCFPDPNGDPQANRAACSGAIGTVCQAAFRGTHAPFAVKSLADNMDFLAGGFCFPDCSNDPNACASHPGTTCASLDATALGEPWNGVSMCLLPHLSN